MAQHFLLSAKARDFSLRDIDKMSEDDAWWRFVEIRWGGRDQQGCPGCGAFDRHYAIRTRKQWRCKHCTRTFSVTSSTVFADRKLSFKDILRAIFIYVSSAKGISHVALATQMGVAYKTAMVLAHKLREALYHSRDTTPLSGLIHIDGGHFCGKPRRPRVRNKKPTTEELQTHILERRRKGKAKPPGISDLPNPHELSEKEGRANKRISLSKLNQRKKRNRRIIFTLRQVHQEPGLGAFLTRVAVGHSENEANAMALAKRYIAPGSTVHSDENPAYFRFDGLYQHHTVEHSKEYATEDGIHQNQAESYFSRIRRYEYGVGHQLRARYLMLYANEMAWREDYRRQSVGARFSDLLGRALQAGYSKWWRGYWQGCKLPEELIMV
ncbi:IS1595 family transposase [Permianibacter sp. IMCC34836]|uniref:IS1595 family transposase n=1 Tax=Permianibacter fluminis TaxID=2738515 RepID=UPI001556305F|nr:IS1595 family transposase [Permianibacter fluminis]NQD37656.1 IS1595 family transposase [Permianibacter fluminis]